MFLPTAQRGWLVAVLISLVLVVVAALATNQVAFRHRFGNALLKTILHALLFSALSLAWWYFARAIPTPSIADFIAARARDLIVPLAFSAILVFCAMLVANFLTFSDRLSNVVAAALVFAVFYGGVVYAINTLPLAGNLADLAFL
jgi:hypothetical protein